MAKNSLPKAPLGPPGYPYAQLHGGPPPHGLPADLSVAAVGLYSQTLGMHNNIPPGLNNYPRGLVSSYYITFCLLHLIF